MTTPITTDTSSLQITIIEAPSLSTENIEPIEIPPPTETPEDEIFNLCLNAGAIDEKGEIQFEVEEPLSLTTRQKERVLNLLSKEQHLNSKGNEPAFTLQYLLEKGFEVGLTPLIIGGWTEELIKDTEFYTPLLLQLGATEEAISSLFPKARVLQDIDIRIYLPEHLTLSEGVDHYLNILADLYQCSQEEIIALLSKPPIPIYINDNALCVIALPVLKGPDIELIIMKTEKEEALRNALAIENLLGSPENICFHGPQKKVLEAVLLERTQRLDLFHPTRHTTPILPLFIGKMCYGRIPVDWDKVHNLINFSLCLCPHHKRRGKTLFQHFKRYCKNHKQGNALWMWTMLLNVFVLGKTLLEPEEMQEAFQRTYEAFPVEETFPSFIQTLITFLQKSPEKSSLLFALLPLAALTLLSRESSSNVTLRKGGNLPVAVIDCSGPSFILPLKLDACIEQLETTKMSFQTRFLLIDFFYKLTTLPQQAEQNSCFARNETFLQFRALSHQDFSLSNLLLFPLASYQETDSNTILRPLLDVWFHLSILQSTQPHPFLKATQALCQTRLSEISPGSRFLSPLLSAKSLFQQIKAYSQSVRDDAATFAVDAWLSYAPKLTNLTDRNSKTLMLIEHLAEHHLQKAVNLLLVCQQDLENNYEMYLYTVSQLIYAPEIPSVAPAIYPLVKEALSRNIIDVDTFGEAIFTLIDALPSSFLEDIIDLLKQMQALDFHCITPERIIPIILLWIGTFQPQPFILYENLMDLISHKNIFTLKEEPSLLLYALMESVDNEELLLKFIDYLPLDSSQQGLLLEVAKSIKTPELCHSLLSKKYSHYFCPEGKLSLLKTVWIDLLKHKKRDKIKNLFLDISKVLKSRKLPTEAIEDFIAVFLSIPHQFLHIEEWSLFYIELLVCSDGESSVALELEDAFIQRIKRATNPLRVHLDLIKKVIEYGKKNTRWNLLLSLPKLWRVPPYQTIEIIEKIVEIGWSDETLTLAYHLILRTPLLSKTPEEFFLVTQKLIEENQKEKASHLLICFPPSSTLFIQLRIVLSERNAEIILTYISVLKASGDNYNRLYNECLLFLTEHPKLFEWVEQCPLIDLDKWELLFLDSSEQKKTSLWKRYLKHFEEHQRLGSTISDHHLQAAWSFLITLSEVTVSAKFAEAVTSVIPIKQQCTTYLSLHSLEGLNQLMQMATEIKNSCPEIFPDILRAIVSEGNVDTNLIENIEEYLSEDVKTKEEALKILDFGVDLYKSADFELKNVEEALKKTITFPIDYRKKLYASTLKDIFTLGPQSELAECMLYTALNKEKEEVEIEWLNEVPIITFCTPPPIDEFYQLFKVLSTSSDALTFVEVDMSDTEVFQSLRRAMYGNKMGYTFFSPTCLAFCLHHVKRYFDDFFLQKEEFKALTNILFLKTSVQPFSVWKMLNPLARTLFLRSYKQGLYKKETSTFIMNLTRINALNLLPEDYEPSKKMIAKMLTTLKSISASSVGYASEIALSIWNRKWFQSQYTLKFKVMEFILKALPEQMETLWGESYCYEWVQNLLTKDYDMDLPISGKEYVDLLILAKKYHDVFFHFLNSTLLEEREIDIRHIKFFIQSTLIELDSKRFFSF